MARAPKPPAGYEKSKFDRDAGVKEGSAADMRRDAKAIPKFLAAKKAAAKPGAREAREVEKRVSARNDRR